MNMFTICGSLYYYRDYIKTVVISCHGKLTIKSFNSPSKVFPFMCFTLTPRGKTGEVKTHSLVAYGTRTYYYSQN